METGDRGLDSKASREGMHILRCVECGVLSCSLWPGWRGYRCDDPETDEPPALAFYCPNCASREFGIRA